MITGYSNQKNVLVLISLLKEHGIRKVVASPGTSNMPLVASLQYDPYFEMYSSVDERSAAYIACGLAEESGEPVVITCTGATASRNYMPGLTEAFYRKIPVLAVTSSQDISRIGQNSPQLIDRRTIPNDIAKLSIHIPNLQSDADCRNYTVLMNKALLELRNNGGGPVHINLTTEDGKKRYETKELPKVRVIRRVTSRDDVIPNLPTGNVAIYVGAHSRWSQKEVNCLEAFCEANNAVVLVDHTSNYKGKYSVFSNIVTYQEGYSSPVLDFDLLIHIGHVIGTDFQGLNFKEVWRVNIDGEVRDTFGRLTYVFQMDEADFFARYTKKGYEKNTTFYAKWAAEHDRLMALIPELPLSNIWAAHQLADRLPNDSVVHYAIQNSLRSWNFFAGNKTISGYSNTGGFGIDGNISSLIGASFANPKKIFYGVVGDLAFFYDMNALGNRHIGNNVRIILVNNNGGQQFRNHDSSGFQFGDDVNTYMAAADHYVSKEHMLVAHYAQDLGFEYFAVRTKEEFKKAEDALIAPELGNKPILVELFTQSDDEREAYNQIVNLIVTPISKVKRMANDLIGEKAYDQLVRIVKGDW